MFMGDRKSAPHPHSQSLDPSAMWARTPGWGWFMGCYGAEEAGNRKWMEAGHGEPDCRLHLLAVLCSLCPGHSQDIAWPMLRSSVG